MGGLARDQGVRDLFRGRLGGLRGGCVLDYFNNGGADLFACAVEAVSPSAQGKRKRNGKPLAVSRDLSDAQHHSRR